MDGFNHVGISFIYNNSVVDYGGRYQNNNYKTGENILAKPLRNYKIFLCGEYRNKGTISNYFTSAKKYYVHCKGIIDKDSILRYKRYLNQHYKPNSIRIRLAGLNQFLKYMDLKELCVSIPHEKNTNQKVLDEQEIDRVLSLCKYNDELHLIVRLLWDGCIRPQTIIDLRLSNRHGDILYCDGTKTGDNHIKMSQPLIDAWEKYLCIRPEPQKEHSDVLFICGFGQYNGLKYSDPSSICEKVKKLGVICGISFRMTPYTIRRTSATLRQDQFSKYYAGDSKLVQMMFNHSDIRTTMRYNQKTDRDIERYFDSIYKQPTFIRDSGVYAREKPYNSLHSYYKNSADVEDEEEDEDNSCFSFSVSFFVLEAASLNVFCMCASHPIMKDIGVVSQSFSILEGLSLIDGVRIASYPIIDNSSQFPVFVGGV